MTNYYKERACIRLGIVCRALVLCVLLMGLPYGRSDLMAQTEVAKPRVGATTLSGHIIDAESRETLIGATVFAPEVNQGTYTNSYGFFSLTTKQPVRTLRISYIGYETKIITLGDVSEPLRIELKPQTQLQEVVVTEERKHLHAPQPGAIAVPVHIIKQTPALLGENDLMKALQHMPGVQSGSEGSAGVHVRGGGADENLILLDGVSLYNVDHLLGFFSVFTPEAVKKVDLYKGNFPARFGGRLSSVIDVRTNDGNMQRYKGVVSLGLLSSKVQFEGPIIKDRTSFNISARRTYFDLLMKPFLEDNVKGGYYFYDLNAKLQHRLTDRDRLFLSFYHGRDEAGAEEKIRSTYREGNESWRVDRHTAFSLGWGNTLAALRWNHIFSPKLYSDLTLSFTRYHFGVQNENGSKVSGKETYYHALSYNSGIQDLGLNWNAHLFASPKLEMRFGLDYIHHSFRPESYGAVSRGREAIDEGLLLGQFNKKRPLIPAHHAALYAEAKAKLPLDLELNAGLRSALFAVDGKAYLSLQPRLSLDWRATPTLNATLGYSRMAQNVHLLTSAYIALPIDLWVPATKNISPMTSDQVSLGMNYRFGKGWMLGLEGYYKQMNHVLEYQDGVMFFGSSDGWESKVETGRGRSYGLEAILMRQVGRTTGWLSYNLSKTERRFPNRTINQGAWFPYKYDRRHKVNIVVSHKFSRRLDVSASWEFFTGGTMTLAYERMDYLPLDEPDQYRWSSQERSRGYVPERNNYRLGATHRLNLSANFNRFHKRGARSIWNVSIYNVYNAKNPAFVFPGDITGSSEGSGGDRVTQFTLLPFIPSVSYTYKF